MHKIGFLSLSVSSQEDSQYNNYLKSLNPLLMKNIAYIGSWKHFVFVFVCVWVSLYLSFCKSPSRSLSSPDDKLSENIWFVWSETVEKVEKVETVVTVETVETVKTVDS